MSGLDETTRMRNALQSALERVELTQGGYEHIHDYETGCQDIEIAKERLAVSIADDLLAELERHGWKLVQVDPFSQVVRVSDLARRVQEIEAKLADWVPQEQA